MRWALILGVLLAASPAAAQHMWSRPYECTDCIGFWNYVAHGLQDYTCGTATYPGHNGTDYVIIGGNAAIALGHKVIAAKAGTVTVSVDGNKDDCTACGGAGCGTGTPGGGFSNYVTLDHGGEMTIYGHMRKGSITVQVGDTVECGDVLGEIASAGCSTGAHLHFEPQRGIGWGTPYDPYEGMCNPGETSSWHEQGGYRGLPGLACDVTTPPPPPAGGCPPTVGPQWSCEASDRVRCVADAVEREPCPMGCVPDPVQGAICALPPADADGDGHDALSDCDDLNPAVFPGAIDVCGDGIDQDCVGGDLPCGPLPGAAPGGAAGAPAPGVPAPGAPANTFGPQPGTGTTNSGIIGASTEPIERGGGDSGCSVGGGPTARGDLLMWLLALGLLRRRRHPGS